MHKLCVFALDDTLGFAVLNSSLYEPWARHYSSTLETRLNYSPADCFENMPFPQPLDKLRDIGHRYLQHRGNVMLARGEGLTKTYNRFHDPEETADDIQQFRVLRIEMDNAVAAAYGWTNLDLAHGFHETKQGVRFTISESARHEVLARLLKLNHERHAEEVKQGLHDKGKKKAASCKRPPTRKHSGGPTFF